ncbi:serine aminopeptidase domain-containing protein [Nocardioides lijunqiniae]|uniref:alpha/beta hydrolase family protein n=1 Tax=Nocardioides lijunqiniae TaxID=2760832 RepID=UPI001877C001|nr:alpha/beta hydrolase [Nocardioides lijunqiniae]
MSPTSIDIRSHQVTFPADDHRELHGTLYEPTGTPQGAVVIAGAVATRSHWYAPLAACLADHGFATLIFDYRGNTDLKSMQAEDGDALRWGGDAASALEHLLEVVPSVPVTWIGHSFGGQMLPFSRHDLVDKVILVATGSGYWRWLNPRVRWAAPIIFGAVVPFAIRVAGYFPGRRLGVVGDAPANVMRQWSRWCLSPDYVGIDVRSFRERASLVTVPVLAISMADDDLITERSSEEAEGWFDACPIERIRLSPEDVGVESIGHGGFFRPAMHSWWETELVPQLPRTSRRPSAPATLNAEE